VQLGYLYTINSSWSAGIDARYERTKFVDEPTEKYNTTRVRLNATYRVSRPLEIRFSVGQDKRDADEPSDSYTDNIALVGVNYRFF
jgi:predicted porin